MARGFFITGTDTEVGKTYVSTALIKGMSARGIAVSGYKPVASDAAWVQERLVNEDALKMMASASVPLPYDVVNPYCFEPAIAPHLAAKKAAINIEVNQIKRVYEQHVSSSEVVIVEGAGGWKVPLSDVVNFDEVPKQLGLPVILVVGLKLGCINHALLTEEAINNAGCHLVGWVGNEITPTFEMLDENVATLKTKMRSPCIGLLKHCEKREKQRSAADLNIEDTLDYLLGIG